MPRNGSGVYSKPAGTTAAANTTIESAKYNSTIDDLVQDANTARPIVAGGTGATSKAGATTALEAVSYGAAQTLTTPQKTQAVGNIEAVSYGAAQTLTASQKNQALSNIGVAWERIGGLVTATAGSTQVAWTDLSAYRFLRLKFDLTPASSTALGIRASTDNGSTYKSGATDYKRHGDFIANGTWGSLGLADANIVPLAAHTLAVNTVSGEVLIDTFNVSGLSSIAVNTTYQGTTAGFVSCRIGGLSVFSGAKNAFQLVATAGSFEGRFSLEGLRA